MDYFKMWPDLEAVLREVSNKEDVLYLSNSEAIKFFGEKRNQSKGQSMLEKGHVKFNGKNFEVNWRKTFSYLAASLTLRELIALSPSAKGCLLDVGCGRKPYYHVFQPFVKDYVGLDCVSKEENPDVDVCGRAECLPFPDESFETVLCSEVLALVKEPAKAVMEMHRVLKKGGILIFSAPQNYIIHDEPGDFYRYTRYGLKALAENAGFKVLRVRRKGGFFCLLADQFSKFSQIFFTGLLGVNSLSKFMVFLPQKLFFAAFCFSEKFFGRFGGWPVLAQIQKLLRVCGYGFTIGNVALAVKE